MFPLEKSTNKNKPFNISDTQCIWNKKMLHACYCVILIEVWFEQIVDILASSAQGS